ncbi:MAG TPA: universal stress protein [Baekduia sp.]|uniref:universal stress protein n=1 Tax=Baekduia sp. TaxID=2600305 RepID=UPI002CDE2F24|nr:universal stress protein [Baekduia sp.]HMJ36519.1 universal stress protein [Baekduia sp.]
MGCYHRILVAVDGSPDAEAALRHATTLARDQHAQLILLTVVPAAPPQLVTVAGATELIDLEATFAHTLRAAADGLPQDVGVETRLCHGSPARRILEVARDARCDLVVMGFHGHGRLHHALVGSVSRSVLHDSPLPVLLMRAGKPEPVGEPA